MPIKLKGATSGDVTVSAPAVAGTSSLTLPTGTVDLSASVSMGSAWTAYTPSLGNWTLGNGTVSGSYCQIGKTVFFRASMTFGSTSAAAASVPTLSLPVTAVTGGVNTLGATLNGMMYKGFTGFPYGAYAYLSSTTAVAFRVWGTNGVATAPSTTSPFTWAVDDKLVVSGVYEAA